MLALCVAESYQAFARQCPPNAVKTQSGSCECNSYAEIFNEELWSCRVKHSTVPTDDVRERNCPADSSKVKSKTCKCSASDKSFDNVHWRCSAKPSNNAPCPKKSAKNADGSCLCDYTNNVFDEIYRLCCPVDAYANEKSSCLCYNQKYFFDSFHWQCIPRVYLTSTQRPITTTRITTTPTIYECHNKTRKWPNCYNVTIEPCPEGKVGYYPHCYDPCPRGLVGYEPHCHVPCPEFTHCKFHLDFPQECTLFNEFFQGFRTGMEAPAREYRARRGNIGRETTSQTANIRSKRARTIPSEYIRIAASTTRSRRQEGHRQHQLLRPIGQLPR